LKINEIFLSIQGESTRAGFPCAFVRLTGCNLRCAYCDTKYAYDEGSELSIEEVLESVSKFPVRLVEITGGEPLLQPEAPALIATLADRGNTVLLETNGSISLEPVDNRAIIIMDIKCPGSGMSEHMRWENIRLLKLTDEVKFVISNRRDYDWALAVIEKYRLGERHAVNLAPAFGVLEPHELARWMLESPQTSGWNLRLQLQLHRYIWPHIERGV
jgi:7-carboxy-7-deazaguanine synthase